MYDELERAAGTRSRSGISILGWIAIALFTLGVMGVGGAWFAYRAVRAKVVEVVDRVEFERPQELAPVVARTVARTLSEMGAAGDLDAESLTAAVSRAMASNAAADVGRQTSAGGEDVEGFLRIRTGEGEFRIDLQAGEEGGALVIQGPDGEAARFGAGRDAESPPRWLPEFDREGRDVRRVASGRAGAASFGAISWTSDRSPEALVDEFRSRLEADGWDIRAEHALSSHGDDFSASVVGHRADDARTILFGAGMEDGETRVVLGWGEGIPSGG